MPGFCGICGNIPPYFEWPIFIGKEVSSTIKRNVKFTNSYFQQFIIPKFVDDKLFFDGDDLFICTDGVFLNKKDIISKNDAKEFGSAFLRAFKKKGIPFISELRGDFSGFIYNKKNNIINIFSNHIGSKPLYYYLNEVENILIFGSSLNAIIHIMRKNGYNTRLSELSAYCLLTFGYMLHDNTLCDEIKKIPPGTILQYDLINGTLSFEKYYELKNTPYIDDSKENILKEMNRLFEIAIHKEYEKDVEYGYKHIATLSGGLDSRMNVVTGKKLGFNDILTITFSQNDYLDEKIAKQISSDLNFEFLFYSLDNGNYLKNIEKPILANDGQAFFAGAAHALAMINLINWEKNGLIHTGQIGDLILGSYLMSTKHSPVSKDIIYKAAYSTKLIKKIPQSIIDNLSKVYETDEIFVFYERCVNGIFNGYQMMHHYSEFSSPFLYLDFLDYVMKIHPKHRYNNVLYEDWINSFMVTASKYIWEKSGVKINDNIIIKIMNQLQKQIRIILFKDITKISMNPFDAWYKNNIDLRETFEHYFDENIKRLDNHPALKKDTIDLFSNGSTLEKTQSLSLLAAVKMYDLI